MRISVLARPAENVVTEWQGVKTPRVKQWCCIEIDGLPTSFQITVNPGEELKPGEYVLAPNSFSVTNGRLQMTRAVLIPAPKPAPVK